MTNVFVVHGVEGYPEENWFPWLKQALERHGHNVTVPQFPTPKNQTLSAWLETLEQYAAVLTPDTVVVGHSLGVPFLLSVLERQPVKAAFFVAGFVGVAGNAFDESMKTFAQKQFDWERIHRHCKNFFVFHSDNDPYIPLAKAQELAGHLHATVTVVSGAGHFNSAAGYTTFDLLAEKIEPYLS